METSERGFNFWFWRIIVWCIVSIMLFGFISFTTLKSKYGVQIAEKLYIQDKILGNIYLCSIQEGRLGNHLFEYASVYGIAKSRNSTVIVTKRLDLVEYFNLPHASVFKNYLYCSLLEKVVEKSCCTFDKTLMNLSVNKSYVVGNYLQSWKYFRHVLSDIRKEFTFKEHIREPAAYIVRNLKHTKLGDAIAVGIHIRAGDVISSATLRQAGYRTAPSSYIHNAIEFMMKIFKRIVFIVCSQDLEFARTLIGNKTIEVYYFSISPAYDMAILSECDHVIMTVGTFGWWSGFLSNGIVIYYKYPFRENSTMWFAMNHKDFYLPNWIALE